MYWPRELDRGRGGGGYWTDVDRARDMAAWLGVAAPSIRAARAVSKRVVVNRF